jgi:hypothetical protein
MNDRLALLHLVLKVHKRRGTNPVRISLLLLVIGIFATLSALSFPTAAAPLQHRAAKEELQIPFKTRGLTNGALIAKIFEGDFVNIDLDRTDNRFGILFGQYLEAFARYCSAALPQNKVEMTRQRCVTERVTRNGFGIEISRTCIEYETVGTGLFAKPALYDALNTVNRQRAADIGRELSRTFGDIARPDAGSAMAGLIGDAQAIASDMTSLVQINACTAPGLMRFEDNLRLFALNKQPIRLGGKATVSSVITPPAGQPFKDQNYRKLIEDLILDDTKRWGAFARFIPGSVTNVSIEERDKLGRPMRVIAPYTWDGLQGITSGRVTLTFSDGLPECLTYSETPSVCHSPNRRIVARYLEGGYNHLGMETTGNGKPLDVTETSVGRTREMPLGIYRVERDTQLHSEPHANASIVTKLSRGTKVRVVSQTGAYLEVRSRQGRSPGYILQRDAVFLGD